MGTTTLWERVKRWWSGKEAESLSARVARYIVGENLDVEDDPDIQALTGQRSPRQQAAQSFNAVKNTSVDVAASSGKQGFLVARDWGIAKGVQAVIAGAGIVVAGVWQKVDTWLDANRLSKLENVADGVQETTYQRKNLVRGRIWRKNRRTTLETDPDCNYCPAQGVRSVDHVRAAKLMQGLVDDGVLTQEQAHDLVNDLKNLLSSCISCNSSKGARLPGNIPGTWLPKNPSQKAIEKMRELGTWVDE